MMSSGLEKIVQGVISLFSLLNSTRQKSASFEPLTDLLAFVVGKLWPKNDN